jgi:hypothetical protein
LQFGEEQDSGSVGGDIVDILYMTKALGGDTEAREFRREGGCMHSWNGGLEGALRKIDKSCNWSRWFLQQQEKKAYSHELFAQHAALQER